MIRNITITPQGPEIIISLETETQHGVRMDEAVREAEAIFRHVVGAMGSEDGAEGDVDASTVPFRGQPKYAPAYATEGSAGADLRAAIPSPADVTIPPGGTRVIRTGVAVAIPHGHVGLIHPRSGLARHRGITVLNAPGTIDSDYRGEIEVLLHNTSDEPYCVADGDQIGRASCRERVF